MRLLSLLVSPDFHWGRSTALTVSFLGLHGNESKAWALGGGFHSNHLGMLDNALVVCLDVSDLDILACDGISHRPQALSRWLVRSFAVRCCFNLFTFLRVGIDGGVPLLLFPVQLVHELLNVWHRITAAVVLARGHDMVIDVHVNWDGLWIGLWRSSEPAAESWAGGSRS